MLGVFATTNSDLTGLIHLKPEGPMGISLTNEFLDSPNGTPNAATELDDATKAHYVAEVSRLLCEAATEWEELQAAITELRAELEPRNFHDALAAAGLSAARDCLDDDSGSLDSNTPAQNTAAPEEREPEVGQASATPPAASNVCETVRDDEDAASAATADATRVEAEPDASDVEDSSDSEESTGEDEVPAAVREFRKALASQATGADESVAQRRAALLRGDGDENLDLADDERDSASPPASCDETLAGARDNNDETLAGARDNNDETLAGARDNTENDTDHAPPEASAEGALTIDDTADAENSESSDRNAAAGDELLAVSRHDDVCDEPGAVANAAPVEAAAAEIAVDDETPVAEPTDTELAEASERPPSTPEAAAHESADTAAEDSSPASGAAIHDKLEQVLNLLKDSLDRRPKADSGVVPPTLTHDIAREVAGKVRDAVLANLPQSSPTTAPANSTQSANDAPQPPPGPKRIPIDDVAGIIDQLTGGG